MTAATTGNFLDGGTVDPFTGLAPGMTPEEQAAADEVRRRTILRNSATQTANINSAPGGYLDQRSQDQSGTVRNPDGSNMTAEQYDAYARDHNLGGYAHGFAHNLSRDPVTMGVLAAPYAVLGAGAALGGLAAGGVGSIATPAGVSPYVTGFGAGTGLGAGGQAAALAGSQAGGAAAATGAANAANGVIVGGGAGGAAAGGGLAAGMAGAGAAGASGAGAAGAAPWWAGPAASIAGAAAPVVINEVFGGRTKEEDALIAKQEQMAQEAQRRQGQQQDQRMNQLGQQLLAFNPTNQMLAQAFGPGAAFSPEQMAQMTAGTPPPTPPPNATPEQAQEYQRRRTEFDAAEASRRDMMMNGTTPVGPGPAPMQMPAPQAARRY